MLEGYKQHEWLWVYSSQFSFKNSFFLLLNLLKNNVKFVLKGGKFMIIHIFLCT